MEEAETPSTASCTDAHVGTSPSTVSSTNGTDAPPRVTKPHDLVKKEDVEKALLADKGPKAVFKDFSIVDFTTKGDNYACIVSSVEVLYAKDGRDQETSYVVKLNPCRDMLAYDVIWTTIFMKETGFYREIVPLINKELKEIHEPKLRVPAYFHSVETPNEQVIFLEDMRRSGFKMYDRKKGMDRAHTNLIISELARLHSASVLMMSSAEFKGVNILDRFPLLEEAFKSGNDEAMDTIMTSSLENGAEIAEEVCGYPNVSAYIRGLTENLPELMKDQYASKEEFKVICHGDCWNNNFLFKYSPEGAPTECRLLDLQVCRVGSLTLDLNYMLYCSLTGSVRRAEIPSFFKNYYATFASVMAAAGKPMKFTLPQFRKEFLAKNNFALIMAMLVIPAVLMEVDDVDAIEKMFDPADMEGSMIKYKELLTDMMKKNKLLRQRFLDLFDDLAEAGLFKTSNVPKLIANYNSMKKGL